jgi:uncharacterized protein (TIGR03437 family)
MRRVTPIFVGVPCLLATAFPTHAQSTPSIFPGGIVNAASYAAAAPLAPGSIAAAFGNFLLTAPAAETGPALPTNLGGLSLQLSGGQLAPLFYASGGEVNFQVPWELAGATQMSVSALLNNQPGASQTVSIAPFAPGIFSLNSQGTGQGAILDSAYKVVDASNPATAGSSYIQIYATGLGAVSNQPASGSPALAVPLSQTTATPTVAIGDAPATVIFSGLAPTLVGVYQINALVPVGSAIGIAVPVSISIGGVPSNTVTMAVNPPPGPSPIPSITALSPFSAAPGATSSTLTITGTGFVPSSSVSVNGVSRSATFVSGSQLTVTLTAPTLAAAGSYPVAVVNPSPGGGMSNAVNFIVQAGFGSTATSSIAWSNFGRDAQHTALSLNPSQPLNRIRWSTPVDLKPQYTSNELLIHYGSPLLTPQNTVIVPVKTGATSGFEVEALSAANGAVLWTLASDYVLPPHDWVPEFGPALTPSSRVYLPGAGGTVYYRDSPDSATGQQGQIAFYGLANYQSNEQSYTANVMISTPIVSDSAGDIYFGFEVIGATPLQLQSGIARIGASGQGSWIAASAAAGDPTITEVVQNCTPALSQDQGKIYIAVSNGSYGYLLALNSTTLQKVASVALKDPVSGQSSTLSDLGTASPTIGVDGDVYYGVLENPEGENHYRGWLLHFDSLLANSKTPGAFGWDDTPSIVPSFMVPSYAGTSPYLLMTKYNDYADAGGTGQNRIAILDPNATETYTLTGTKVMNEVATILGATPNTGLPGVKEWCIDSAAVDPATGSVLAGSEDGKLYRWDLATNSFSQSIVLTSGLGEAYTPTLIGPDGSVYAINNATLFAVGQ